MPLVTQGLKSNKLIVQGFEAQAPTGGGLLALLGCGGGSGGGGGGPTVLLKDLFAGTLGTLVTAHTMDVGPGWTLIHGSPAPALDGAGAAYYSNVSTDVAVDSDSGQANVTATGTANFTPAATSNTAAGIYVRGDGTWNNLWLLDLSFGTVYLYELLGGVTTQRGSATLTVTASTPYALQLVASGTSLTVTVNGGSTINWTSADLQTNTHCGFYEYCDVASNTKISAFEVTTP